MTAPVGRFIDRARGRARGRLPREARSPMRRIVVRIDAALLERIDGLVSHWPDSSRASLIRAFCLLGLAAAEEAVPPRLEEP